MYPTAALATSEGNTGNFSIANTMTVAIHLQAVDEEVGSQTVRVVLRKLDYGHSGKRFALRYVHGAKLETITNIDGASLSRVSWTSAALSIAILTRLVGKIYYVE